MKIFAYLEKEFAAFEGWLETLVGHHQAGTLPAPPVSTAGAPPVIVGPAPKPVLPDVPPPAAPTLPEGISWADQANGLVHIAALEQYYPGRKYAVKQSEDFVTPGSSTFYALVQNIQNCTFAAAHDMIQYGVFHPAKPNGLTNGYSLDTSIKIDGAFVCPDDQPTYDSVVTWLSAIAQANAANPANQSGGSGFSPGHQGH